MKRGLFEKQQQQTVILQGSEKSVLRNLKT